MPTSSVVAPGGGERTVWVLRDADLIETAVTVGLTDGQRSQVSGGNLKVGDLVVVGTVTD